MKDKRRNEYLCMVHYMCQLFQTPRPRHPLSTVIHDTSAAFAPCDCCLRTASIGKLTANSIIGGLNRVHLP